MRSCSHSGSLTPLRKLRSFRTAAACMQPAAAGCTRQRWTSTGRHRTVRVQHGWGSGRSWSLDQLVVDAGVAPGPVGSIRCSLASCQGVCAVGVAKLSDASEVSRSASALVDFAWCRTGCASTCQVQDPVPEAAPGQAGQVPTHARLGIHDSEDLCRGQRRRL